MEDDNEILSLIRSGDLQAYALLVKKYQGRVRGDCLGVLGTAAEADDAAQEVFIKAYKGLAGFRGSAGFSTWLYRITVNHCRDLLRRSSRSKQESWEALREREGESAEPRSVEQDTGRQVREALEKLSEEDRSI